MKAKYSYIFIAIVLILAINLLYNFKSITINNSLLSALPQSSDKLLPKQIESAIFERLDSQIILLIGDSNKNTAKLATQQLITQLKNTSFIDNVFGQFDEDFAQNYAKFIYNNRLAFIDNSTRQKLNNTDDLSLYIISNLYSGLSGVSSDELINDPLLLTRQIQLDLLKHSSNSLKLEDNFLTTSFNCKQYYFVLITLAEHINSNMQSSAASIEKLNKILTNLQNSYPSLEILKKGSLLYSSEIAMQTQNDIQKLAMLTIIFVIAIIFTAFLSIKPLLLTFLSLIISSICAFSILVLLKQEIYLMTSVLSLTIIGLSVDYTIYFMARRKLADYNHNGFYSIKYIYKSLLLALSTVVIAYTSLIFTPFAAISQMALIAILGLVFSCACVLFIHPLFSKKEHKLPNIYEKVLFNYIRFFFKHITKIYVLCMAITIFSIYSLFNLNYNDDISALQELPIQLQEQEKKINTILKQQQESTLFIVYDQDTQSLLDKTLKLYTYLDNSNALLSYAKFNLNSIEQSYRDLALVNNATTEIKKDLTQKGIDISKLNFNYSYNNLDIDNFLNKNNLFIYKLLYLKTDSYHVILVPLINIKDKNKLQNIANELENTIFFDKKEDISNLFKNYRHNLEQVILLFLITILTIFIYNKGFKYGFIAFLPSILSLGFAITILHLVGGFINLFTILSLILVLGIGINYSIFFSSHAKDNYIALFSTVTAMLTSCVAFSLLLLSQTKVIEHFAVCIVSGVICAFILSPLASLQAKLNSKENI